MKFENCGKLRDDAAACDHRTARVLAASALVPSSLHTGRPGAGATAGGREAMSFSDEERAELIAALSLTADMFGIPLKQLDLLLDARDSGRVLTDGEATQIRQNAATWRHQLDKLRSRLTGLTIEPPKRVQ